jgi:hypothetical protein
MKLRMGTTMALWIQTMMLSATEMRMNWRAMKMVKLTMVPHSFKHMYSLLRHHMHFFQLNLLHCLYNFLEQKRARTIPALEIELGIPQLPTLLHQFLFKQLHPDDPRDLSDIPKFQFPSYEGHISIFNSASYRFYAPSDISRIGGMCTEYIHACPLWQNEAP